MDPPARGPQVATRGHTKDTEDRRRLQKAPN